MQNHSGVDNQISKSIIFDRPAKGVTPEAWVLSKSLQAGEPTKRLTVDVPEALHHRIKVQCAIHGVNMADVVRRRIKTRDLIAENQVEDGDRHHIHSVLALCGLPYREPGNNAREHL